MKSSRNSQLFFQILIEELRRHKESILAANMRDVDHAVKQGFSPSFCERLKLSPKDFELLLGRVEEIGKKEEIIGKVHQKRRLGNGVRIQKISVPLGTILVIYEARPEVTIDVAILGIKSGNRVILKGGSEAEETNRVLFHVLEKALEAAEIPGDYIQRLDIKKRSDLYDVLQQKDRIDLVIARGGYAMVSDIQKRSQIPVLAHSSGGARIYVDKSANQEMALAIITNAKVSKPAACNSVDTVLVHEKIAKEFIPLLTARMKEYGVTVKTRLDWNTELLDLIIGVKIVKDAKEAVNFIKTYTKKHTEGLVAKNQEVIDLFVEHIDAAALMINCSTRLHDGGVFGLGAEMGIATGKLHARGPVGFVNLTTYKWIAYGNGQVRK